ncbi:MAG: Imm32 family immunity protein [Planctomycetota bacterium]
MKFPENKGKLDIYPRIDEGDSLSVTIMGDPNGLRYLSEILRTLADFDQESDNSPAGEREHIHLHRQCQLGEHSCEVEICRADAKGTGELPDFMR